jgi:phosphatidylinositol-3-phosphatase
VVSPPPDSLPERIDRCSNCTAALAHDQRWCVECGERRGAVSPAMQALIAGTAPVEVVDPVPVAAAAAASSPIFSMPSARAAAVAVCALLAFGVMLGSSVSPVAQSAADAPIIVAVSPPAAAPAPAEDAAPADSGAVAAAPVEAAPQQQIIYQTVPQNTTPTPTPPAPLPIPPLPPLPSVSHVFIVMLTGHGYEAAFGANSQATYLSKTLTTHGELIPNYYGITHGALANEIGLISGQGPTKQTAANCPEYTDVTPGTQGDQGQATGDGCVYPADVKTLADQLFTAGNTWKAYVEGAGTAGCDRTTKSYETWRNPFLNFHSLNDNAALCNPNVVDLPQLQTDLAQVGDTPGLSYIVPNSCHDGSDVPCSPGAPAGLPAADTWLQTVIPQIEQSAGYKQGGLIAITFDSAPKDGPEADSTACCGQPETYPNLPADDPSQQPTPAPAAPDPNATAPAPDATSAPAPDSTTTTDTTTAPAPAQPRANASQDQTTPTTTPPPTRTTGGGGKVGLLLISPYVTPNTVNNTGYYNHFSLFASIEDLFSQGRIAYGNLPDLTVFDNTVYTAYNGGASNGDSGDQPVSGSSSRAKKRKR